MKITEILQFYKKGPGKKVTFSDVPITIFCVADVFSVRLFWQSCPGCPFLAVLPWLSFPSYPFLPVLFGPFRLSSPILALLSWLSCPGCCSFAIMSGNGHTANFFVNIKDTNSNHPTSLQTIFLQVDHFCSQILAECQLEEVVH
jgi:hypothetical protein